MYFVIFYGRLKHIANQFNQVQIKIPQLETKESIQTSFNLFVSQASLDRFKIEIFIMDSFVNIFDIFASCFEVACCIVRP